MNFITNTPLIVKWMSSTGFKHYRQIKVKTRRSRDMGMLRYGRCSMGCIDPEWHCDICLSENATNDWKWPRRNLRWKKKSLEETRETTGHNILTAKQRNTIYKTNNNIWYQKTNFILETAKYKQQVQKDTIEYNRCHTKSCDAMSFWVRIK